jgi:DNA-binding helix-turn-helix protein
MSAKDFALGAGIPQATLSQILNEKQLISVSVINKVIEHYSELVDPYEFLFGTPAPSSDPYEMGLFPSQMVPSAGDKSSDGMREIIRTQSEEIVKLKTELALRSDKEIDRIMVFYTDNSFKTFRCND